MTKITVFSRLSKRFVIITFSLTISLGEIKELKRTTQSKMKFRWSDQIKILFANYNDTNFTTK